MWNAARFLGILAFSSDSEGRKVFPGRIEKASNNSLKSLMLEGRTGESCEYTQDVICKFVCCGLLESVDQKNKDCGCFQVYKTDQADWINPWFSQAGFTDYFLPWTHQSWWFINQQNQPNELGQTAKTDLSLQEFWLGLSSRLLSFRSYYPSGKNMQTVQMTLKIQTEDSLMPPMFIPLAHPRSVASAAQVGWWAPQDKGAPGRCARETYGLATHPELKEEYGGRGRIRCILLKTASVWSVFPWRRVCMDGRLSKEYRWSHTFSPVKNPWIYRQIQHSRRVKVETGLEPGTFVAVL